MKPEDEHKNPGHDPQQANGESPQDDAAMQQALRALRQLPAAQAPVIVRARAKHAFLRGRAGQRNETQQAPAATPEHTPERRDASTPQQPPVAKPELAPVRRDSSARVVSLNPKRPNRLLPIAFAAAVLLMLFGYGAQSPHPWRLMAISDPDGDLRGRTDLSVGSIVAGGRLDTPEHGEFELSMGSTLRIRMAPCSGVVLPPPPRRWNPGEVTIEVAHGELFGSTGGKKLPAPVHVVTDVLSARITGTTFSVQRIPGATCICLLEGSVQITPTVGSSAPIDLPVGHRVLVFNDGRPHDFAPIDSMERTKMQMLRDRATPH